MTQQLTVDSIVLQREPLKLVQRLEQGVGELRFVQCHVQFERLERLGDVDQRVVGHGRQPVERQTEFAQFASVAEQARAQRTQLVAYIKSTFIIIKLHRGHTVHFNLIVIASQQLCDEMKLTLVI